MAAQAGKSLTEWVNERWADTVSRQSPAEHNRRVIEQLRAEIGVIDISLEDTLRAIDEARAERDRELDSRFGLSGP